MNIYGLFLREPQPTDTNAIASLLGITLLCYAIITLAGHIYLLRGRKLCRK